LTRGPRRHQRLMYPDTDLARLKCALVAIAFAAGKGIAVGMLPL